MLSRTSETSGTSGISRISRKKTIHNNKYKPSGGIKDFIKKLVNSIEPTILNLYDSTKISLKEKAKIDANNYKEFNNFFDLTVEKVSKELDNNEGPIIQYHLSDNNKNEEHIKAMTEIVDKYKELYMNVLINDSKHQLTSDTKEIYPNYLEDLYKKNDKPYSDFENKNSLKKPIVKQSDEEFLETLKLRFEGLEKCIHNTEKQEEYKKEYKKEYIKYFIDEFGIESSTYKKSKSINEQCKSIYYNDKMLKDSNEINSNITLQNEVFKNYDTWLSKKNEIEFAKTFLPIDFFINQKTQTNEDFKNELLDKIKTLIKSNNRDLRQFVFGFFKDDEFEYLLKLRPFLFEVGGMLKEKTCSTSCNPLVNWSIILNMIYSRCSITKQSLDRYGY